MKTTIATIALCLGFTLANAQSVKEAAVPAPVKDAFAKKYPATKVKEWEKEEDGYFSADYFLYTRCAVVAEGKTYYEKILKMPSKMPNDIDFEHLLSLANEAYKLKTGKEFNYTPTFNYETHQNQKNSA